MVTLNFFRRSHISTQLILQLLSVFGATSMNCFSHATNSAAVLAANRVVVTEAVRLTDEQGKTFVLEKGILPLQEGTSSNLGVLEKDAKIERSGGDGEPPRGPLRVVFRNDRNASRGILQLVFANHTANFWLDRPLDSENASGSIQKPETIRASTIGSGQGVGIRVISNHNSEAWEPLNLLLLESDQRPIVDVELLR